MSEDPETASEAIEMFPKAIWRMTTSMQCMTKRSTRRFLKSS